MKKWNLAGILQSSIPGFLQAWSILSSSIRLTLCTGVVRRPLTTRPPLSGAGWREPGTSQTNRSSGTVGGGEGPMSEGVGQSLMVGDKVQKGHGRRFHGQWGYKVRGEGHGDKVKGGQRRGWTRSVGEQGPGTTLYRTGLHCLLGLKDSELSLALFEDKKG